MDDVTPENILQKLQSHPRVQTSAVCMIAGQEITHLRALKAGLLNACRGARKLFDAGLVVGVEDPESWVRAALDAIDTAIEIADAPRS